MGKQQVTNFTALRKLIEELALQSRRSEIIMTDNNNKLEAVEIHDFQYSKLSRQRKRE